MNRVVQKTYDIVVIGGGPGGIPAAVAAARRGHKVLLVERNSFLGGAATSGLGILGYLDRQGKKALGGIAQELMDRLEEIAGKILKLVEEDPAKKNQAATFLNYYLPTTEKLLDSYADFEEAGVSGENLTQAKEKIRRTMDSIMAGFERQLDALYHADAMDVDSDIRVMETMLRRDGGSVEEDFGLGGTAVATQEDL